MAARIDRLEALVRAAFALAGALAIGAGAAFMWGFTVDDALISIRYAHHLASGGGYRFNVHGPVTDGVTPLVWAPILSLLSDRSGDLLTTLGRARMLGLGAGLVTGAIVGWTVSRRPADRRWAPLGVALLAVAYPLGAWSASGMETPLAMALVTVASALADARARPSIVALIAGLSALFRPELAVWSVTMGVGAARSNEPPARVALSALRLGGIALIPFAVTVAMRLWIFGHPAPLAVFAKPSDAAHGVSYALASAVVVLTPLSLLLAPRALLRAGPAPKTIVIAAIIHVVVVIAVGGDWMPYARLMVPIAPSLLIANAALREHTKPSFHAARFVLVLLLGVLLAVSGAPRGRHVLDDRRALIESARPVLASSRVIAALDVGWVGAACPDDATIVDVAGLTDPAFAVLSGGHTSKAVDLSMLLDRQVDTVILYVPPRLVERRIRERQRGLFDERFTRVSTLALGQAHYEVYRLRATVDRAASD